MGTSPAQRLMGCHTCTLLPTHHNLLKPRLAKETNRQLENRKETQKQMCDKGSNPLTTVKKTRTTSSYETSGKQQLVPWKLHYLP